MHLLAAFDWAADPAIFSFWIITIRWYGLLFATGFIVGFIHLRRILARENKPDEDADSILIHTVIGTIVGARLMHCLAYDPARYLADPISIFKIWEGGLASHGGAIGITIALWLYSRRRPAQPFLWVIDRVALLTAFGGVCIRLGNFFNSEIVGSVTDLPWGVRFLMRQDLYRIPDEAPGLIAVPRHPVQLYEALAYLVIYVALWLIYRRRGPSTPHGLLLGVFLVTIFGSRFLLEFVKVTQEHYETGLPLSVGQLLSIPAVVLGVWLWVRAVRRGPPQQYGVAVGAPPTAAAGS